MTTLAPSPIMQAVKLAQERGLLPTTLSSKELQEFTERLEERIFFSARTSNLWYVEQLKKLVERYVQGEGRDNDLAKLRIEARKLLAQAGYTPENGFPGDAELGIPPATAGSLRDLSSEKRLNLIFETNAQMMRGLGMKLRGLQRMESHPAWELVRYKHARDLKWERDWERRWNIAGDNVDFEGALHDRMMAVKTSPIWRALGSSALFPDALNVDTPPFAFNSGMGWREVGFRESEALGLTQAPQQYSGDVALKNHGPHTIALAFADALGRQTADPQLAAIMRKAAQDIRLPEPPPQSAERAAKLAKFQKLQAKFNERAARRGY